jgi:hypothetical protein
MVLLSAVAGLANIAVAVLALFFAALLTVRREASAKQIFEWYRRPDGSGATWARRIRFKPSMRMSRIVNWILVVFLVALGVSAMISLVR